MEYSVAGLAEHRASFPQSTKVTILLFLVAFIATRSASVTLAVVLTHWIASKYLFPVKCDM